MIPAMAQRPVHPTPRTAPAPPRTVHPTPMPRVPVMTPTVYTFYNINSMIAGGAVTDSTWYREGNETLIDSYYTPMIPKIPEDLLPPGPTKEHPEDPFLDGTRSIFSSRLRTIGAEGGFDTASELKEVVAVELFGYTRMVPVDIVDAARYYVAEGIMKRGRHFVVDAQCELGTVYNGEPVYYGGKSGAFHLTDRMDRLYRRGVRYVVSGIVLGYYTHSYYSSPSAKNPTFETMLTVFLTSYDLETHTIIQTRAVNARGVGSKPELADDDAVKSLKSDAFHLTNDSFKFVSRITQLAEPDKKGKIKNCLIDGGLEMGIEKTDIFWVYTPDNLSKKLGKVKIIAPVEGCSEGIINGGNEDVVAAVQAGVPLLLISEGQALF